MEPKAPSPAAGGIQPRRPFAECFRLVCQKRKAKQMAGYLSECMLLRGHEELHLALDGVEETQLPLLAQTIAEAAGLTGLNATVSQKPESGCRGYPSRAVRRRRSTGLAPGVADKELCSKFIQAVASNMTECQRMRWLRLSGLQLPKARPFRSLMAGIRSCRHTLTALALCDCGLTDPAFAALVKALCEGPQLACLRVSGCLLTDESAGPIARLLQSNSLRQVEWQWSRGLCNGRSSDEYGAIGCLTVLELPSNKLGDLAADALARGLRMDSAIRRLDASHNQMGKDGLVKLREMRGANSTLGWLGLQGNPGFKALAVAARDGLTDDSSDPGAGVVPGWPIVGAAGHPEGCGACPSCKQGSHVSLAPTSGPKARAWKLFSEALSSSGESAAALFRRMDRRSSGVVGRPQLAELLERLGLQLSDQQFGAVWSRLDKRKAGRIEFTDLKRAMGRTKPLVAPISQTSRPPSQPEPVRGTWPGAELPTLHNTAAELEQIAANNQELMQMLIALEAEPDPSGGGPVAEQEEELMAVLETTLQRCAAARCVGQPGGQDGYVPGRDRESAPGAAAAWSC